MAQQVFSAAQRESIWKAYEGRCAYSRAMIDVSNFHIDHIVPERFLDEPAEFARISAELGLPENFDLLGYENLCPCSPALNMQKGPALFPKEQVQFFLGIASAKKAQIEENLVLIERRTKRGRAIILLQQCLDKGELTAEEVSTLIRTQPDQIFKLIEAMSFADAYDLNLVRHADIDMLRDRHVRFGENDHITSLTLTGPSGDIQEVRTCREYDTAIANGFYAATTFDIKMSTWFEHQSGLLKALEMARSPTMSFVSDPHVGILDLDLIPFSMFPRMDGATDDENAEITYQDKVDDGTLRIKRVRQNMLQIEETEGMGQQLIEVVRADFNGNGVEDILLFEYCYATHGTLGFGRVQIISRASDKSLFSPMGENAELCA